MINKILKLKELLYIKYKNILNYRNRFTAYSNFQCISQETVQLKKDRILISTNITDKEFIDFLFSQLNLINDNFIVCINGKISNKDDINYKNIYISKSYIKFYFYILRNLKSSNFYLKLMKNNCNNEDLNFISYKYMLNNILFDNSNFSKVKTFLTSNKKIHYIQSIPYPLFHHTKIKNNFYLFKSNSYLLNKIPNPLSHNKKSTNIFNSNINLTAPNKERICFFVHYDKNNIISTSDLDYIKELKQLCSYLYFISTSNLSEKELQKITAFTDRILLRPNVGFDFYSWKEGLFNFGFSNLKKYDELLIVNNSCYSPVYPLANVFSEMENKSCDFWGMTIHPEDNHYYEWLKGIITENVQSYFVCFKKQVFVSKLFYDFWNNYPLIDSFSDTIKFGEINLTKYLSECFTYDSYINTHLYSDFTKLPNYTALHEPQATLLLGSPLIKKKVFIEPYDKNNIKDLLLILSKISNKIYFEELREQFKELNFYE